MHLLNKYFLNVLQLPCIVLGAIDIAINNTSKFLVQSSQSMEGIGSRQRETTKKLMNKIKGEMSFINKTDVIERNLLGGYFRLCDK